MTNLVGVAHDSVGNVHHRSSAIELYQDGAAAAERALPAPLGVAVAGVLIKAAYERSLHRVSGSLGADNAMLALALAAMESDPARR